jgi:hypothetical protein
MLALSKNTQDMMHVTYVCVLTRERKEEYLHLLAILTSFLQQKNIGSKGH